MAVLIEAVIKPIDPLQPFVLWGRQPDYTLVWLEIGINALKLIVDFVP